MPSSTPSKLQTSSAAPTPAPHNPVEDIELDDGLDDHELSEGEEQVEKNMGSAHRSDGAVQMGVVANAIASCCALSFFSISMILANKVRRGRSRVGRDVERVGSRPL